jgi:catechol 2,3-dioxygenase
MAFSAETGHAPKALRIRAGRSQALPGHKPVVRRADRPNIKAMDALNPSAAPTFAHRTPLRIGAVALVVRDLDRMRSFYENLLGLAEIDREGPVVRLGTPGGVTLLELEHRPDAKPDDRREAGLYHTAFLMPTRADHARWIVHLRRKGFEITGASDHGVSEAFYLDDPEGNGIEVYNDRPRERWTWEDDLIVMQTRPLDIDAIVREVDDRTAHEPVAPEGLRVGHIHLRVGNLDTAEDFYRGPVGLDLTRRRGGATFMSSGGYHHHVGANVWHSNGAARRDPDRAGLSWFVMEAAGEAELASIRSRVSGTDAPVSPHSSGFETADPWGNRIRFVAA